MTSRNKLQNVCACDAYPTPTSAHNCDAAVGVSSSLFMPPIPTDPGRTTGTCRARLRLAAGSKVTIIPKELGRLLNAGLCMLA